MSTTPAVPATPFRPRTKLKMIMYCSIGLALAIVVFLAYVALQPNEFRVERSTTIAAAPAQVFPRINDFHQWKYWSPYEKLDPAMNKTYEGPESGVGAKMSWSGSGQVGEGSTAIVASRPDESIGIQLEMTKPFACSNDVQFTLAGDEKQTVVTWAMTGQMAFLPKVVHQFFSMDKMVGGQFAEGLANLKALVEARSFATPAQ